MTAQKIIKRLVLLAISIAFLFAPKISLAAWTKYPGNPIISVMPSTWYAQHAVSPSVIYENGYYKMWFVGHSGADKSWRIGYATSLDGITNWTISSHPVIPMGSLDGWERETDSPYVMHDIYDYKIWYVSIGTAWQIGPDRFRVRYATSQDETNWSTTNNWVLYGTPGHWDSGGIERGLSVLKIGSTYHMWYAGVNEAQMGSSSEKWQIGYATSTNGVTWTKYPSNENPQPVISPLESWELNSVAYPNVIFDGQYYHMWYTATLLNLPIKIAYAYSEDGITWIKPSDKNPVLVVGPAAYDNHNVASPYVIQQGVNYKMWYGGYDGNYWRIGYAENILGPTVTPVPTSTATPTVTPSPSPTPLPTNTPTPSPSPTPSPVPPHIIVFLPGLGASWNHESILTGTDHPPNEWFMTPGVKIYDGLIQTFKNAGYQTDGPNKNLYIFNYNWTKPVEQIANDLKNYINNTVNLPPGVSIDLVGHSLGGLVARTYLQNNQNNQIDQLLTLGSPQHGVPQIYYLWEGGEVSRLLPGWQRFGAELILHFRKSGFVTNKEAVQQTLPVIKNLLPDFNYLKQNGQELPEATMSEKNIWLHNLNFFPPSHLIAHLNTFAGLIPESTLRWIKVQNRNWLDTLLGLYSDGRPVDQELSDGDKTVLEMSAHLDSETITNIPDLDHGDLISQPLGIQKIMDALDLTPSSISNLSQNLDYSQMLAFYLASPAIISITDQNGNPIGTTDGKLAIIPNAPAGPYRVNILGTGNGQYTLHIGQITENQDYWTAYTGTTGIGQSQTLPVLFQPGNLLENPIIDPSGDLLIKNTQTKINSFKDYLSHNLYDFRLKTYLLGQIKQIENKLSKKDIEKAIISLYDMRLKISVWPMINRDTSIHLKNQLQDIIEDLENVYISRQTGKPPYGQKKLNQEIKTAQAQLFLFEKKLKQKIQKGTATTEDGLLFQLAQQKLNQAKISNSYESHINALGANHLSKEGLLILR